MNYTRACRPGEDGTARVVSGVCTSSTPRCYPRCAFHPNREAESDPVWVGVFCPAGADIPFEQAGKVCPMGKGCVKACPSRTE